MGKAKNKANSGFVPNKHLHSRISYLYQAAKHLETNSQSSTESQGSGNSRHLVGQLQGVALRSQIRLDSSLKHTICKRCHGILEEGHGLSSYIENNSRNGLKPWADVLVKKCRNCGATRRFPVGANRQKRRGQRLSSDEKKDKKASDGPKEPSEANEAVEPE